jgi:hypothetical protein
MNQKIPNSIARGVELPRPSASPELALPAENGSPLTAVSPSPVPSAVEEAVPNLHSGRPTKFMPARSFDGYPDGKTKTTYTAGAEAEAPSNYVKHLKSQGLAADN